MTKLQLQIMALASLTILWRPVRYVSVIWLDLRFNRTKGLYIGSSGRYKVSVSVFELIAPELGNVSQSDFISGSCCLVVSFYSLGRRGIILTSIKQERAVFCQWEHEHVVFWQWSIIWWRQRRRRCCRCQQRRCRRCHRRRCRRRQDVFRKPGNRRNFMI